MKAKEYLNQLALLDMKINLKLKELDGLRTKLIGVGSVNYSDDRVQTSPKPDAQFAEILHNIECLEKEINDDIDKLVNRKHEIISQIQELKQPKQIEILYKRYVEYKSLEVIAVEMNYTYPYVRKLHGYALQEFEKRNKMLHKRNTMLQPNVL